MSGFYRRFMTGITWLLLVVYLPGCSHWVVSRRPLEGTVDGRRPLRIDTTDSLRIEVDAPILDGEVLGGEVQRINPTRSALLIRKGYRITPRDPDQPTGAWTVARADVARISIPTGNWGWVETSRPVEELSSIADRLRLHTRGGRQLELRNWTADGDSIRGEVASARSRDWIDIPRDRVAVVSVHRTDVPLSILAGVGLVVGALGIALVVGASLGTCLGCVNGG